jgi:phosphatidylglycerol:prolipoprotein diacylglycerol transferase
MPFWLEDPLYLFRIWEGGMSFHGGLLGGLIAVGIFAVRRSRRVADVFDFMAPLPGIGLFAGRMGNFINGELWGAPTTVPWAVIVNGEARHPSQLYEACLEGVVLFLILWLFSAKPRPAMSVSALFLIGYGVFRFAVEFLRLPDAHLGYLAFGWLTMGQVLTLPMLALGFFLLWRAYSGQAAGVVASR